MAALEDSPTRCQGQSWTQWAQRVGLSLTCDEAEEVDGTVAKELRDQREGDSMKLRKEDMSLFGFCPARDEFYLVVCEVCRQVVKPQALQNHIELRHSNSVMGKVVSCTGSQQRQSQSRVSAKDLPFQHHYHHNHSAARVHSSSSMETIARDKTSSTAASHSSSSSSCASSPKSNVTFLQQQSVAGSNSGGQCKLESKAGSSPLSCSKKSPSPSSPIVRVERMPPCLITKNINSTIGGMGPPTFTSSAIPVDKRELPSPQQPPSLQSTAPSLVHRHNSSWLNSSTAGNSVGSGLCIQSASPSLSACASQSAVNNKAASASSGDNRPKPSSKSKSKVPKERKLLPCKDRVYDPDKHCGVFIQEIGKQCTRSLTCKTHSLAMRRSVVGRKKNFDELLADHRAAKDALIKATKGSVPGSVLSVDSHATTKSAVFTGVCNDAEVPGCSFSQTTATSAMKKTASDILRLNHMNSSGGSQTTENGGLAQQRLNLPAAHCASNKSKLTSMKNVSSLNTLLPRPSLSSVSSDTVSLLAGANVVTSTVVEDRGYLLRHPRPAAVCTFNSRQMGLGFFVYDRRFDNIRAILRTSLGERLSQPPPVKKLCVESRLPPVPEPTDPSDPYCFLVSEQQSKPVGVAEIAPKGQAGPSASKTFSPAMLPLKSATVSKGGGKIISRPKTKQNKKCVSGTSAGSGSLLSSLTTGMASANHATKTSSEASGMLPLGSKGSSDPSVKRKRVSATKGGNSASSTAVKPTAQHVVSITTTTTTGLLPVSFPVSLNAQLTAAVPHLGSAKNGSMAPLVIPVCSSSLVANVARNNTSSVVNSKNLNVVMEVMNGQVAHGTGTLLPRTSNSALCLPITTSDTIRGSLSSLGLGLTAPTIALATLSAGPNRASSSSSSFSPVTTLCSTTTATTDSAHGRFVTKRIRSSAPSRSSKVESITTTTQASLDTKWSVVNSTAVLTGLGSLSNAAMLGGMLTSKNHVAMSSTVNSATATQHSGQIGFRNIRSVSSNPHITSYIANGLGPTIPATLVDHKGLTNHGLSSNSPSSFTASPGSCSNSPSPDLSSPNSEGHIQSRGKGRVNATARSSVGKKGVYQLHNTQSYSGTAATPQVILGKGSSSGMSSPSSSPVIGGSLIMGRPHSSVSSSAAKDGSDTVSYQLSPPFNSPSSIPLKMLSASSPVIASTASNKTHNSKPFSIPVEEFHRPSEVRDSLT